VGWSTRPPSQLTAVHPRYAYLSSSGEPLSKCAVIVPQPRGGKERTLAPEAEVAQGDPWDVRLPTTLVKLRPDDKLPAWTKQPDGEWAES
jgi:hypothetical protein